VPDPLVALAAITGFVLVAVLISLLNERRPVDVGGLFPVDGRNDWPQGVQEPDVPRFVLNRADQLGPPAATVEEIPASAAPSHQPERVLARVHRFASGH
jgi:hypothetical protein